MGPAAYDVTPLAVRYADSGYRVAAGIGACVAFTAGRITGAGHVEHGYMYEYGGGNKVCMAMLT